MSLIMFSMGRHLSVMIKRYFSIITLIVYPINCYAIYYLLKIIEKDRRIITECGGDDKKSLYQGTTVTLKRGQEMDLVNSIRRKSSLRKSHKSGGTSDNSSII